MRYSVIGTMSGSSLDGLDVVHALFHETGGKWSYSIDAAECIPYSGEWTEQLTSAVNLSAKDYLLLHSAYGHYNGTCIREFIGRNGLEHKIQLIASHGHTTFHLPAGGTTAQLGEGAAIAAETGLPVISDLRAFDVALGGQGAPIVPLGEKMLFGEYGLLLNIGGIANMTIASGNHYAAHDITAANQVLNRLATLKGKPYDADGYWASSGTCEIALFNRLSDLDFYKKIPPKSLDNQFVSNEIMPLISDAKITPEDALNTYVLHLCKQITSEAAGALKQFGSELNSNKMLVTGGGALNAFLIKTLQPMLEREGINLVVPDEMTIKYKEALIMAFLGVLRWRDEATTLGSVTGASRNGIGGSVWMGAES
jgi:anhydro-N-acetylmuramic acid kinase